MNENPMTQEREAQILKEYCEKAGKDHVTDLAEMVMAELIAALIAKQRDIIEQLAGCLRVVLDALALSLDADTTAAEIAMLEMMEEALHGE